MLRNLYIRSIVLISSIVAISAISAVVAADKPADEPTLPLDRLVGKRVGDFKLRDVRNGKEVWLYGLAMANRGLGSVLKIRKTEAVVFVFLSPGCPIGDKYLPRLNELAREYEPKGVKFFGIASNDGDTPDDLKAWAERHELAFPILHDPRNVQADALLVERTNEVIVADARAVIRYRGAIDDQYGYTTTSPEPKNRYLIETLDALLASKPIGVKGTEVSGCKLTRVAPEPSKLEGLDRVRGVSDEIAAYLDKTDPLPDVGQVNYAEHVATILQNKCQSCHRPGQVGGFSLLSYDDARKRSGMIAEVVDNRRMPPWHADPRYGHFSNDRKLTGRERAVLLAWAEQGTPLGDPAKVPPAKAFIEGWTIGKPDHVFELPDANVIPAQGTVPYYHITVDPGFKEDVWVQAAEARPGDAAVVHHIIVYVIPPGAERGRTIGEGRGHLCGYAPGDMPSVYPEGTAKRIPAGSKFVFQMHYTPNGKQTTDRSKVGLIVSKVPPTREALTVGIANPGFQIPPGADDYPVKSEQKFRNEVRLLSFMPHMHLRGKSFKYTLQADGQEPEVMLSVPAYDFGWQSYYTLAEPLVLKPGTVIKCDATFDNSEKNRANPDAKAMVRWGEQTWEEMMIGYVDIDFPIRKDDGKPGEKADAATPGNSPKPAAD